MPEYKFADLIDTHQLQQLMDLFYNATNIPVGIIDIDGTIHVATGWQEICTRFHRAHPVTSVFCRESDAYISSHLKESGYIEYKCKNGMWDLAVPIIIADKHLATLFLGQFFYEDEAPDTDFFRNQAEKYGFDVQQYMQALSKVPVFKRKTVQSAMKYYSSFVNFLSTMGLNNLKLAQDIEQRKQIEKRLYDVQQSLEREVSKHTAELAETNRLLKKEIAEHEQANEIIRISEKKYRTLFDTSLNGIVFADMDGHIEDANPAYLNMLGYSLDEIKGKTYEEITPERWHQWEKTEILEKQLLVNGYSEEYEKEYIRSDGTKFPVMIRIWRIKDQGDHSEKTLAAVRDITHRKALKNQLIRSERLAATGQLAASIAHEINSPLQGITSILSTIKNTYSQDPELLSYLDLLKDAFTSIRDTVKKMMELNRSGKDRWQPVNINTVIQDTVRLMRNHLKRNSIELNLDLARDVPIIKASPQQMSQVIINLINNAVEAMNTAARRKNGWEKHPAASRKIHIQTTAAKAALILKVADNGTGFSSEDLEKIFDPFYTRKKTMGIGIGLSVCHGIIEEHGGTIKAENLPEGGAVFTITLPVE